MEITNEPAEVGLGWLQGTVRADPAEVGAVLSRALGGVTPREYGTRWYAQAASVGSLGSVMAWERRGASVSEVYFSVTQLALDGLGWAGGIGLLNGLRELGAHFTRVDVYADDRRRVADPVVVLEAFQAGRVVSHTRTWDSRVNSYGGATTYIGSRQSPLMLRVYRKWAQTGNPRDGVRWELEAKGDRAGAVAAAIGGLTDRDAGTTFWSLVRGLVDFRERVGVQNGDRAPMVAWWAELVGGASRVRLAIDSAAASLARRRAWIVGQVAPSLALLRAVHGSRWLSEVIREGESRLTGAQWALAPVRAM